MREGWRVVRLGDVTQQVRVRRAPDPSRRYRLLGVRGRGQGPFLREELTGSETRAVALTPVHQGQFIYNRLFAGTGSFGVVPPMLDGGWVSSEFPLYDVDERALDVNFLGLVFQQPEVWERVAAECVGTTGSRMRWHERRFAEFVVDLPTVVEQRRIVDLVQCIDDSQSKARHVVASVERSLMSFLDERFDEGDQRRTRRFGTLAALASGSSWKSDDEFEAPGQGLLPVVGIPSTPSGSRIVDVSRRVFVRGLPASVRTLTTDTLLLIRTNGNRERIGNVYRVPASGVGHAYSAFQIGAAVRESRDTGFLFWFLSAPRVQALISEAASGTTGLGNVSISWLGGLEVPWSDDEVRDEVVAVADAIDSVSSRARSWVSRMTVLRATLLTDLLSGEHEIPASYDRFLDATA